MAKRRERGDGGISQRKSDGMWRGQIDVGYRNGKRQRKTVYAKTRKECLRKLNAAKAAVKAGDVTTSSMRVDAWLRQWLDHVIADDVKPRTLVDYRSKVERYLIPTVGHIRLDRLTPAHVRQMHTDLRERTGRKGKPLSERTVHHAHRVLANALHDAMPELGLPRNVASLVSAPTPLEVKGKSLAAGDARKLLDAAEDDRARWLFALYTGARQGESLGLRWEHVDLDAGVADLAWSLQRVPYRHGCVRRGQPATCERRAHRCPSRQLAIPPGMEHHVLDGNLTLVRPKTIGSIRVVELVPGLVHALRALGAADTGPNPHGLVWHRPDGRPVDGRVDYARWVELLDLADVARIPLHGARHTASTLMMNAGVPEAVRMQMLGHSQVSTARGYAYADRTLTRGAALAIETAISGDD